MLSLYVPGRIYHRCYNVLLNLIYAPTQFRVDTYMTFLGVESELGGEENGNHHSPFLYKGGL